MMGFIFPTSFCGKESSGDSYEYFKIPTRHSVSWDAFNHGTASCTSGFDCVPTLSCDLSLLSDREHRSYLPLECCSFPEGRSNVSGDWADGNDKCEPSEWGLWDIVQQAARQGGDSVTTGELVWEANELELYRSTFLVL